MFIVQATGDGRWIAVVQNGKSTFKIYRDSKAEALRCGYYFAPTELPADPPSAANIHAPLAAPSAERNSNDERNEPDS